ncbi:MAG: hypothetical protein K9G62_01825 [Alphaproteobacteria bacterium]|nr:hypothetical protein [Alphaproteobacteria bacterium]
MKNVFFGAKPPEIEFTASQPKGIRGTWEVVVKRKGEAQPCDGYMVTEDGKIKQLTTIHPPLPDEVLLPIVERLAKEKGFPYSSPQAVQRFPILES